MQRYRSRIRRGVIMSKLIDLTGLRFGRLVVIKRGRTKNERTYWRCLCDCGTIKDCLSYNLKHSDPKRRIFSCGCWGRESRLRASTTHGKSKSPEMQMFWEAKKRARKRGMAFDIEWTDILIPDVCPFLDIPISVGQGKQTANSPALDRKDSSRGYVKGNIQVISNRANTMKHDATFNEFERMYLSWRKYHEVS